MKNKDSWRVNLKKIDTILLEDIRTKIVKPDWDELCYNYNLSENFIREFQNKLNWKDICECQELSENFIREFQNKVNWKKISGFQTLSENFIREFQNKVNWQEISQYQKISIKFIIEFKDKIKWDYLIYNIEKETCLKNILKCSYYIDNKKIKNVDLKNKIKILKQLYKEERLLTNKEVEPILIIDYLN